MIDGGMIYSYIMPSVGNNKISIVTDGLKFMKRLLTMDFWIVDSGLSNTQKSPDQWVTINLNGLYGEVKDEKE